jgi:L-aminopeptidase/D-esterase-like protein
MICYGFKGGSGTASRHVAFAGVSYYVGVFVQANFGRREQLTIAGVAVGAALKDWEPDPRGGGERGSVIAILATDAPLLPHQLKRLARRVGLGIGRGGAISGNGSGDILLAFSTANADALHDDETLARASFVPDWRLDPFFEATIEAVDEAVINALVVNETMTGCDDHTIHALPHDQVARLVCGQSF